MDGNDIWFVEARTVMDGKPLSVSSPEVTSQVAFSFDSTCDAISNRPLAGE